MLRIVSSHAGLRDSAAGPPPRAESTPRHIQIARSPEKEDQIEDQIVIDWVREPYMEVFVWSQGLLWVLCIGGGLVVIWCMW
jgi:hypothetical protein